MKLVAYRKHVYNFILQTVLRDRSLLIDSHQNSIHIRDSSKNGKVTLYFIFFFKFLLHKIISFCAYKTTKLISCTYCLNRS